MFIVKYRTFFFTLSAIIVAASIASMVFFGFNFGIDFNGGSVLEVQYVTPRTDIETVRAEVASAGVTGAMVSPLSGDSYSIKARVLTEDERAAILQNMAADGSEVKEIKFSSIGPSVGSELTRKAYVAISMVILCIVLFIMFAFRKLKNSLNYGVATIIALAHDVVIPTGIYIAWAHFHAGEIDLLFVTALLAILGYSVHDTIVVFDRVRENLLKQGGEASGKVSGEAFEKVVGASVSQTFGRSINTSLTIFLVLVALYFIGGLATRNFAFVLLIGVIAGTYSSIFVASPLLVTLEGWRNRGGKK